MQTIYIVLIIWTLCFFHYLNRRKIKKRFAELSSEVDIQADDDSLKKLLPIVERMVLENEDNHFQYVWIIFITIILLLV